MRKSGFFPWSFGSAMPRILRPAFSERPRLSSLWVSVALLAGLPVVPSGAESSFDGKWTGDADRGSDCRGTTVTLIVGNGAILAAGWGPVASPQYLPAAVGEDGKATLIGKYGHSVVTVAFSGDHFELRGRAGCGDFVVIGNRVSR